MSASKADNTFSTCLQCVNATYYQKTILISLWLSACVESIVISSSSPQICGANGEHLLAQLHVLGHEAVGGGLGQARGDARAAELQEALEEGLLARLLLRHLPPLRRRSVHLQHMPAGVGRR